MRLALCKYSLHLGWRIMLQWPIMWHKIHLLIFTWFGMPVPASWNIWLNVHSRGTRSCKKNQDKIAQNPLFWVHKRKCSPSHDMPMSHVILLSLWALSTFCNIDIFCLHLYLLIWALVEAIYYLSLLLPCLPLFYLQRYTLNCNCAYICLEYTVKARIILSICMGPTSTLNTKSVGNKKKVKWNSNSICLKLA